MKKNIKEDKKMMLALEKLKLSLCTPAGGLRGRLLQSSSPWPELGKPAHLSAPSLGQLWGPGATTAAPESRSAAWSTLRTTV